MVKNSNFFSNFLAHPVETPWPTWMDQCQNVRRSVPYIRDRRQHLTTLRKTETVDGSRCCRRNPQNWYYVTQFLAHPVEPRERFAMGPYTCDSWIGKGSTFFRTLLICLYFNRF